MVRNKNQRVSINNVSFSQMRGGKIFAKMEKLEGLKKYIGFASTISLKFY